MLFVMFIINVNSNSIYLLDQMTVDIGMSLCDILMALAPDNLRSWLS